MKHALDLATWNRREHFEFFRRFEEPYFGLTFEVEVTAAYDRAKAANCSFFTWYLHKTLLTANEVEAFRYRIEGEEVTVYDRIHVSSTINRGDGTFDFSFIPFASDISTFADHVQAEVERVKNSRGLFVGISGNDVIHFSALPWVRFTALSHARPFSYPDSVPKVSFGKMVSEGGRRLMPVSVHAHHALVDGMHVGMFAELLQEKLNE